MIKKTIMLCLLCLFTVAPVNVTTLSAKEYVLDFHKNDFTVEILNGDTCRLSSTKYNVSSECNPMLPDLPIFYVTLLLPKNKEYVSYTYKRDLTSIMNNVYLKNGSTPQSLGQPTNPSNNWYPNNTYYPSVEFIETVSIKNYHLVSFKIQPCTYYPNNKRISFHKITLNIELDSIVTASSNVFDPESREIKYIKELIWEKDSLEAWYGESFGNTLPESGGYQIPKDKYYIVTTEGLKNAFQPLMDWKRMKGLDGEIITMNQINISDQSSAPNYLKVKRYLYNIINNDDIPDKKNYYVLLGGDVDSVPTAHCISPTFTSDDAQHLNGEMIPCDMYYACFEGVFDWDGNHNGIIGEENDGVSFFQNIFLSRASVNNSTEAETFVNKSINYERNPPIQSNWGNSILFCGSMGYEKMFLGNNTTTIFLDNAVSDLDTISRKIASETILPYWNGQINYLYDSSSNLYTTVNEVSGTGGYIDRNRMAEQMRNNYSLIYETSHGGHNYWYVGASPSPNSYYTSDYADTLSSVFPKIILTSTCHSNGFDLSEAVYGPSISETLIRNANSGIVAYIGSSREGFMADSSDLKKQNYIVHSQKFDYAFMNSLFKSEDNVSHYKDKIEGHLAKLVDEAKKPMKNNTGGTDDGRYYRRLLYSINTLGDPEMQLYKEKPKIFEHVICNHSVGENGYYNISLSIDSIDDEYYINVKDGNTYLPLFRCEGFETYEYQSSCDSLEIVVSKQGYIPLYLKLFRTKYIQNEIFQENTTYVSNYSYIFVGRNVTDSVPYGSVQIESGKKLVLKPKKEIMIKNSFEVPVGAEFEMDINN